MKFKTLLENIYTNLKHESSFGSIQNLYKAAKQIEPKITIKDVKSYLQTKDSYTLHRPHKNRFLRRKTVSKGLYHQMQMDLVDLSSIKRQNRGYCWLLTAIDVFSRFAFAIPLKNKQAKTVLDGIKEIFAKYPTPKMMQTDRGLEFINSIANKYYKEKGIHRFSVSSDTKNSIIERFNRTLKSSMWKYFTENDTLDYLTVLNDLVMAYNKKVHRSIQIAPINVTEANEKKIWKRQYASYFQKHGKTAFKYKNGDVVRISKLSRTFKKGYLPSFQEEYFVIRDRLATHPPVYKLKDLKGEHISGIFYTEELTKISPLHNNIRILKTRKRKGKKEHLIHQIGNNPQDDTWYTTKEVKNKFPQYEF
jgi:hypothetical protein